MLCHAGTRYDDVVDKNFMNKARAKIGAGSKHPTYEAFIINFPLASHACTVCAERSCLIVTLSGVALETVCALYRLFIMSVKAAVTQVAKKIDWEAIAKIVVTDEGKRELTSLRRTYDEVNQTLESKMNVVRNRDG